MKAINKVDFEIGDNDIPISIYSAVEQETRFKQISNCCKSPVRYRKICEDCESELQQGDINKALSVGQEMKQIDTDKIKVENGNLSLLGVVKTESEEDGYFRNGTIWFIGVQIDSKNKRKNERSHTKFGYIREALQKAGVSFLCSISVRGKEHLILLKPYCKGLLGLGLYHSERIRKIQDITGYSVDVKIDDKVATDMSKKIKSKPEVSIRNYKDKRNELIMKAILTGDKREAIKEPTQVVEAVSPMELVAF